MLIGYEWTGIYFILCDILRLSVEKIEEKW